MAGTWVPTLARLTGVCKRGEARRSSSRRAAAAHQQCSHAGRQPAGVRCRWLQPPARSVAHWLPTHLACTPDTPGNPCALHHVMQPSRWTPPPPSCWSTLSSSSRQRPSRRPVMSPACCARELGPGLRVARRPAGRECEAGSWHAAAAAAARTCACLPPPACLPAYTLTHALPGLPAATQSFWSNEARAHSRWAGRQTHAHAAARAAAAATRPPAVAHAQPLRSRSLPPPPSAMHRRSDSHRPTCPPLTTSRLLRCWWRWARACSRASTACRTWRSRTWPCTLW